MIGFNARGSANYFLDACGSPHLSGGGAAEYELRATANGEPVGQWFSRGIDVLRLAELEPDGVVPDTLRTLVNDLRDPTRMDRLTAYGSDGKVVGKDAWAHPALGSKPRRYASATQRYRSWRKAHPKATPEEAHQARAEMTRGSRSQVNSYDLTLSPAKSLSVLHAAFQRAGREEEAAAVWEAIDAGANAVLDMIRDEMAYTRRGVGGPKIEGRSTTRHAHADGVLGALFRHHTSRDAEPQLHIHAMFLNRAWCEDDEQWRALHAAVVMRNKHALDAVFQRVTEARLYELLGLGVATRPDGKAREVVGISQETRDFFSSRRRAVDARTAAIVQEYNDRYGKDPEPYVLWRITQQATLRSREKKREGVDRADDLERWDRQAATEIRTRLASIVADVEATPAPKARPVVAEQVIAMAIADMNKKSTWSRSQLTLAVATRLPDRIAGYSSAELPALIRSLVDRALASGEVRDLTPPGLVHFPDSLRDPLTGRSVYDDPSVSRYATEEALRRETSLVERLARETAPKVTVEEARAAVRAGADAPTVAPEDRAAARGLAATPPPAPVRLATEQEAIDVAVLTSGRSIELVIGPAGTGKTATMAALNDATRRLTGRGMIGFTTAQNAADVLAAEGVDEAVNISRWLQQRVRAREGLVLPDEQTLPQPRKGDRVVVDEASMVSRDDLHDLLVELDGIGVGQVVIVGDTEQIDAVEQGGSFGLLVSAREPHRLSTVRRFAEPWEREASTDLREGRVAEAAHAYHTRSRMHGGDREAMTTAAVQGYMDDVLAGKQSIVVVGTTEVASEVASHVRERLIAAGRVQRDGTELRDGNAAGVGDIVATRRNAQSLRDTRSGARYSVVNRESWQVDEVLPDGGLLVHSLDPATYGTVRALPRSYVDVNVELGYAGTVHAVQGRTVDTGHLLGDDRTNRAALYSGMTRGRERNTVYLETGVRTWGEDGKPLERQSPMERFTEIADTVDRSRAALTVDAAEKDRADSLGHHGPIWQDLLRERAAVGHTEVIREVLGDDAQAVLDDAKSGGVFRLLRAAEGEGRDAAETLREALSHGRTLAGARTPAGLLHRHLDEVLTTTPAPGRTAITYLGRCPTGDDPHTRALRETADRMDSRVGVLGQRVLEDVPAWAVALGPKPPDDLDPATAEPGAFMWQANAAMVAAYREQFGWDHPTDPIGPLPSHAEPDRRWVWQRAADALGIDPAERDIRGASEGELLIRTTTWEAEQAWMPPNVDDRLRTVNVAREEAGREAGEARATGREEDVAAAEAVAERMRARAEKLEEIAAARAAAYEATRDAREAAREAAAELERRERMAADPEAAPDVVTDEEPDAEQEAEEVVAPEVVEPTAPEPTVEDDAPEPTAEQEPIEEEPEPTAEEPEPTAEEPEPAAEEPEPSAEEEPQAAAPEPDPEPDPEPTPEDVDAAIAADLETARAALALLAAREAEDLAPQEEEPAAEPAADAEAEV